MKKVSYTLINTLLALGVVMLVLVLALYGPVASGATTDNIVGTPSGAIIYTICTILLIFAIVALVLINITSKPIVQTAGSYLTIIFGVLLVLTFFMVFYIGIVNIFIGVGLIVFSALFIKANAN